MFELIDEPKIERLPWWQTLLLWLLLYAFGWLIVGAVFKLTWRLFQLGWELV